MTAADARRTRERNLVDASMRYDGSAGRTRTRDDIDDAVRQPASAITSASFIAVSGVVSAGFSTTVLPQASAGASFHAAISSGKFQGMTCPATPSGRGLRPGKRVLELVGPARVVKEMRRGQGHVDIARLANRLAAVQ